MWIFLHHNMNNLKHFSSLIPSLLSTKLCETTAKRTTYVLKRTFPIRLHKKNEPPKRFRRQNYVYDVVKNENVIKKPNVDVILTAYVEGLGKAGDEVSIRPFTGYEKLIVPGLAVYKTPENIERYKPQAETTPSVEFTSKYSLKTLKLLSHWVVGVPMSDINPWTLEPWHLRVAFRQNGFVLPESAIQMPKREISGPHKDQQRKEFYVTVSISEHERVKVRCRIYLTGIHVDAVHRSDWIDPSEPLFEEDRAVLDSMPKTSELPYFDRARIMFNR